MKDEKETLRRLIEDVVEADLRYCQQEIHGADRHYIGERVAREVMRRLDRERIQVTSST